MDSSGVGLRRDIGSPWEGIGYRLDSGECSRREGTVRDLCSLILAHGAVLIRAPPQTGKTSLLDLVQLNPVSVQAFKKVYRISLARLTESFTFDDIWRSDIGKDVSLFDLEKSPESCPEGKDKQQAWPANMRPNLLLVDEGQNGFRDKLHVWDLLKLVQGNQKKHLKMLIVSAWGSHDVYEGPEDAFVPPGNWAPETVVSLWPTVTTSISVQLRVDEATEIWKNSTVGAELSESMRDKIFDISDRQPGLLLHVIDYLRNSGLKNSANPEAKAVDCLISPDFYSSLSSLRSIMRLQAGIRNGAHAECLRKFLRVMLGDCEVTQDKLSSEERKGAAVAVRWGQVTEHLVGSRNVMKLPSRLHKIFFMKQLYLNSSPDVRCNGLCDFVIQVVERMNPGQLVHSVSRTVSENCLYERMYQVEFYRAALTVLPMGSWLSPDAGKLLGAGGFLDFYLTPYLWGFEISRDGSRLKAHLDRFKEGGLYQELLLNRNMVDYVVLNFTEKSSHSHSEDEHLIHVVFREGFKTAELFGSRISNGMCSISVKGDAGLVH